MSNRAALWFAFGVMLASSMVLLGCRNATGPSIELAALLGVPPLVEPLRTATIENLVSIDRGESFGIRVQAKVSTDAVPKTSESPSTVLREITSVLTNSGWSVRTESLAFSAMRKTGDRVIDIYAMQTPTAVRLVVTGHPA